MGFLSEVCTVPAVRAFSGGAAASSSTITTHMVRTLRRALRSVVGITLLSAVPCLAAESLDGASLTLPDTIRRALANNLDLRIRDISPLIAQDALMKARAEFDPAVFAEVNAEDIKRQQNSIEFISTGGLVPQQGIYEEENLRTRAGSPDGCQRVRRMSFPHRPRSWTTR
jgi:hypothetical protein